MNPMAAYFQIATLLCGILATPLAASEPQISASRVAVDYPMRALREGRQGTVIFTVVVGPDGKPKSCSITTSSGHADLDHAACHKAMRTARFAPAASDPENQADRSFSSKAEFKISE
jgi:TonB family protein